MKKAFEKIIDELKQESIIVDNDAGHRAVEIIEHIAEEYKSTEYINCSTDKSTDGWIPCSEQLPEEGVDVLVWFEYFRFGNYNRLFQTAGISYTYDGKWSGFVNGSSGWRDLKIIAWQPLPQPYKECEQSEQGI